MAFYHVGVEQHWWGSFAACGGELATDLTLEDLKAQLGGGNIPRKPCDRIDWELFGLSLAGYNAGHRAVSRYMDIPPFAETQRYVRRVLRLYYHYKKLAKKSEESK